MPVTETGVKQGFTIVIVVDVGPAFIVGYSVKKPVTVTVLVPISAKFSEYISKVLVFEL